VEVDSVPGPRVVPDGATARRARFGLKSPGPASEPAIQSRQEDQLGRWQASHRTDSELVAGLSRSQSESRARRARGLRTGAPI
jgi:hypothetical protein